MVWKPIPDYPNYQVSNTGNVRSLDHVDRYGRRKRGKILSPQFDGAKNYLHVSLNNDFGEKVHQVHRLVAEAFCERGPNDTCVNHKDENKTNNNADNLEWCTHSYNCTYGSQADSRKGGKNPQSKIPIESVIFIKKHHVRGDAEFGTTALAKKLGISTPHVSAIANGSRWGWLKVD